MNMWCEKEIQDLINDLAKICDPNQLEAILDRILTPREINDAAKRLSIIKKLKNGESYSDISSDLGVSPNTISKISLGLGYGFRRTNQKVLNQIKPKEKIKLPHLVESNIKYKGVPTYEIKFK